MEAQLVSNTISSADRVIGGKEIEIVPKQYKLEIETRNSAMRLKCSYLHHKLQKDKTSRFPNITEELQQPLSYICSHDNYQTFITKSIQD